MRLPKAILLIASETNLCRTLAAILAASGYRVTAICQPEEALYYLSKQNFDLVLLDLKVSPQVELLLLPKIHQLRPCTPVLILASKTSTTLRGEALRRGASDCLCKPINPENLLTRVEELLLAPVRKS